MEKKEVRGAGIFFIILGIGLWILPLLGLQFKAILFFTEILGVQQWVLSVICVALGLLAFYGARKK